MSPSSRAAWLPAAFLAGLVYLLIGRLFTLPATNVRVWRLAAWLISAAVYGLHIWYEHFRLRATPRRTASHVALAVAIGALGLAVAGMIQSLSVSPALRPTWLLALVAWPAVTAIPAFLGAFLAAKVLATFNRSS